ncbi:unnamed protein product, partial [Prorocentrum cordatum]
ERWKEPLDVDPRALADANPGQAGRAVRQNRGAQTAEGGNPKKRRALPESTQPSKKMRSAA